MACGKRFVIEGVIGADHLWQTEPEVGPFPRGGAHGSPLLRIPAQQLHRAGQCRGLTGRNQDPVMSRLNQFGDAANAAAVGPAVRGSCLKRVCLNDHQPDH